MENEKFFLEYIKNPLNKLLMELSRNNVSLLETGNNKEARQTVKEILNSSYFQVMVGDRNESYDCHLRFTYESDSGSFREFSSRHPLCLSPIPNESFFYCRGSLTEATRSLYDEIIPSRDYSSHSYKWEHLYSIEHIAEALGLILKELPEELSADKKHRIHLFGFLGDGQRSYTQLLSTKALKELCAKSNDLKQMCESEKFEFIAVSLYHTPHTLTSRQKDVTQSEGEKIDRLSPQREKKVKKNQPKTYVIFIDSLDSSIFKNKNYLENFPSLNKIFEESLFFENFTSSGFWTFPCLHSLQSGIPPKYSASFLRIEPATILNHQNKTQKIDLKSLAQMFCFSSYNLSGIKIKSLTRLIRDAGIRIASIKSSSVNSNYWNLQEGVDVSIENSTIDLIPYHLKQLKNQIKEDKAVIFIDIDTLHRGPLFYKKDGVMWGVNELDFIHKKQSKKNRLLGIKDTSFDERAREQSQIKKVDMILEEILQQTTEQDTVIIFSDNGSQSQPKTIPKVIDFIPGSSGTIEKIWRPTLLVKAFKQNNNAGIQKELVSTNDIFSIVLHACGLGESNAVFEDKYIDSILPPSLGGKEGRKAAETFGINYYNHLTIEWVKRYDHDKGDYKAINLQGKSLRPIFEFVNDLDSEYFSKIS